MNPGRAEVLETIREGKRRTALIWWGCAVLLVGGLVAECMILWPHRNEFWNGNAAESGGDQLSLKSFLGMLAAVGGFLQQLRLSNEIREKLNRQDLWDTFVDDYIPGLQDDWTTVQLTTFALFGVGLFVPFLLGYNRECLVLLCICVVLAATHLFNWRNDRDSVFDVLDRNPPSA